MRNLATFALLALIPSVSAQAENTRAAVTGIFSDLYYNQEGGDLLGTELFIVLNGDGNYVVFFQHWEGGGDAPVVVSVKVDPGNHVSFSIPEPLLGAGIYKGQISMTGFQGTWIQNGKITLPIKLERKKSYWQ